jgi:hypothetical protein
MNRKEKREYPVLHQYENGQQQLQLHFSYYKSPQIQVIEW